MSISSPVNAPWSSNAERVMLRFVERLLLTSVVVDQRALLRLEYNELRPRYGFSAAAYVLYNLDPNMFLKPIWAARLARNRRNSSGTSYSTIVSALLIAGFNPLGATFLNTPTLCHVYSWGELPMLLKIDEFQQPVIFPTTT